jgi:hypothetical protein
MRLRRAITWGLLLTVLPTLVWLLVDFVTIRAEYDLYSTGAVPAGWWREEVSRKEIDERLSDNATWQSFRKTMRSSDDIQAFRAPGRPWFGLAPLQGYAIRRGKEIAGTLEVTEDGKQVIRTRLKGE